MIEERKFVPFPKIGRLSRGCTITEKIDGTNGLIFIGDSREEIVGDAPQEFLVGSRTRWITPENDNMGFARWAYANKEELMKLGPGHHFGEWWGIGIQRNYGLKEKRFSLFNSRRWARPEVRPACCSVVPVIYEGIFDSTAVEFALRSLIDNGSFANPGFLKPEGIVIYHHATKMSFKKTIEKDEAPKGKE